MTILAFTGHRPDKLVGKEDIVKKAISDYLDELKPDKCISGMAMGVDMFAARICVEKNIPFIAAIPFMTQASGYPNSEKAEYISLLDLASHIELVSPDYVPWAFQKRNEWMVDNSDIVCAVWDGTPGGTANCIKYCKSKRVNRVVKYLKW